MENIGENLHRSEGGIADLKILVALSLRYFLNYSCRKNGKFNGCPTLANFGNLVLVIVVKD